MRIVFFGTSHGVPEANQSCSCILLEVGERRYFIDMGRDPNVPLKTRRIPFESVKAVFITHMHTDHTDGLIPFLGLCSWYYTKADPHIYLPDRVEETAAILSAWMTNSGLPKMGDFSFSRIREGLFYEDEAIRITAYPTKHIAVSYAFLVEAEGKRVLFGGDLSHRPQEDFPKEVLQKPLDLAICESAHFAATEYLPIFKGCDNLKKLCITHYSDRFLASVLELTQALPEIPVLRANDGMEIVL